MRPEATTVVQLVIDQGDTWRFRFRAATHDGGTLVVARPVLEGSHWHLELPAEVIERLGRAGARPAALE